MHDSVDRRSGCRPPTYHYLKRNLNSSSQRKEKYFTDLFGTTRIDFYNQAGNEIARVIARYDPKRGLEYQIQQRNVSGILERGKTLTVADRITISRSFRRKIGGIRAHVLITMPEGYRYERFKDGKPYFPKHK